MGEREQRGKGFRHSRVSKLGLGFWKILVIIGILVAGFVLIDVQGITKRFTRTCRLVPGGFAVRRPWQSELQLGPAQRVAVCISGDATHLHLTSSALLRHVVEAYPNADLFLALAFDEHSYKLLGIEKARVAAVELVWDVPQEFISKVQNLVPSEGKKKSASGLNSLAQQLYLQERCAALVETFEQKAKFKYQWFIAASTNHLWEAPPPYFSSLNPDMLTVPYLTIPRGYSTSLAIGPRKFLLALQRTPALDLMKKSRGVNASSFGEVIRRFLVHEQVGVDFANFPVCQLSSQNSDQGLKSGNGLIAQLGSPSAINGALCKPCSRTLKGSKAWEAVTASQPVWGWGPVDSASAADLEICDPHEGAKWRLDWEEQFKGMRPHVAMQLQELGKIGPTDCLSKMTGLTAQVGLWKGPSAALVCIRHDLGDLLHVGTDYGGWSMFHSRLNSQSLVYSFGVGTDISWDLTLIQQYGVSVHAFDNTPVSMAWLKKQTPPARWHHHKFLLGAIDGTIKMALPKGHWTSFSSMDASARGFQEGKPHLNLPCLKLETLMKRLHHEQLEVLKLDIEGAEFAIIRTWVTNGSAPKTCQLLIEFHARLVNGGEQKRKQAFADLASMFFFPALCRQDSFGSDDCTFFSTKHC